MTDTPTHYRSIDELPLAAIDLHLAQLRERRAMLRVRHTQSTRARNVLSDEKMRDKIAHEMQKLQKHIAKMQKDDDKAIAMVTAIRVLCMQAGSPTVESMPQIEDAADGDEEESL